jgi:aspartate/methionine/tyrosine aminotransferase
MVSERARAVEPFIAMDVLERASRMDDVVHLEVGEPDFDPPEAVFDAAVDSLRSGNTDYTAARGKPELRRAIAERYDRVYGVSVDPDRIVVTPGSSPGLLLAVATLLDAGDEMLLTDPHYACYPNFVRTVSGRVETVPLRASEGFQPRVADFEAAMGHETTGLLVNSPANPTGAVLEGDALSALVDAAENRNVTVVADEIYHGLSYDVTEHTVLEYTDDAFALDGFSKRYGMTGWRLGWMVVPEWAVDAVNRLAQNLLICAPNFVQDAGVAALRADDGDRLDRIRETYRARRDTLLEAVEEWGLDAGYTPAGAYYLLVDVSDLPGSSLEVADLFLEEAGVAVTPGIDFGDRAADYVRLSCATDTESVKEGARRVEKLLANVDH